MNLKSYFKALFIIGIFISFLSLFFDWYSFQAINLEGELVAIWNFHLLVGWNTIFSQEDWFNEVIRPNEQQIPQIITVIYILIMIISVYSVLFADFEKSENLEKAKKFSYIHISQLLLSGFYICIIPIYYWIPQKLFFPFVIFMDFELEIKFVYTIGIGYLLQSVSFTCIFPFSLYYYYTSTNFEKKDTSLEIALQNIMSQVRESLDFDKLISEEKLKLQAAKEVDHPILQQEVEINQIYNKFLKMRGVK